MQFAGRQANLPSQGTRRIEQRFGNTTQAGRRYPAEGRDHAGQAFRHGSGWAGDTNTTWRIEGGAFVGGTSTKKVPRNEFLRTQRRYTNFVLRVSFKLVGTDAGGFINGGVQIRSEVAKSPTNEMVGYQCDIGEGWWGALYDESRRNKVLIKPADGVTERAIRKNDWNQYVIRCEGRRIRTAINGVDMIDYTEADESLPQ